MVWPGTVGAALAFGFSACLGRPACAFYLRSNLLKYLPGAICIWRARGATAAPGASKPRPNGESRLLRWSPAGLEPDQRPRPWWPCCLIRSWRPVLPVCFDPPWVAGSAGLSLPGPCCHCCAGSALAYIPCSPGWSDDRGFANWLWSFARTKVEALVPFALLVIRCCRLTAPAGCLCCCVSLVSPALCARL